MKRLISLIIIASSVMCVASAANTATSEDFDNAPMWGVRATFDVNIPGNWRGGGESIPMFRNGYGFSVGTVCNIYLGRNFYFEPGVSLFYDTYSYKDLSITDSNGEIVDNDPEVRKFGVRLPLLVGYEFNVTDRFAMTVFTGPEFNCGIYGKIKARRPELFGDDMPIDLYKKLPGTDNPGNRRFDMAWCVGVGFPISPFLIAVNAEIGVTDLLPGNMTFRENRVSVSATYYF